MILSNSDECPFCDKKVTNLESHLKEDHFLNINTFYEMDPVPKILDSASKHPLTFIDPDLYYIPNWSKLRSTYERNQTTAACQAAIHDYFGKVMSDRYLQMFLSNDFYFNNTLTHSFEEFKEVLKLMKHGRSNIWSLKWLDGFPNVICKDNIKGIIPINLGELYNIDSSLENQILVNDWIIEGPCLIPFDTRHHSRYNIFNTRKDTRETKRMRFKNNTTNCLKYRNNSKLFKSILEIKDKNGSPVYFNDRDLITAKLVVLRNRPIMKLLGTIIDEFANQVATLSDNVFLKNTVDINPRNGDLKVNLSWTSDINYWREGFINISIF